MIDTLTKCFCLPELWSVALCVLIFVVAYSLYRLALFLFQRSKHPESAAVKFFQELRYPILLLFFEIAAFISLYILNFKEKITSRIEHGINLLVIATLSWMAIGITRVFYRLFLEKNGTGLTLDIARRSVLTQALFLYRLLMFIIYSVAIAAILLTFPYVKNVGLGILGSAGVAGIALGIAARPILLSFIVGFQVAVTKMIKIGDAIFIEGEFARVESIYLTRVVVCTWDLRRTIIPISYFIDKPFQNWDLTNPELLGSVFLYCDYTAPVEAIRKRVGDLIADHPNWNKRTWNVQVTNCTENTMEVRIVVSANDSGAMADLCAFLREKLIDFLQQNYPNCLPVLRNRQVPAPEKT